MTFREACRTGAQAGVFALALVAANAASADTTVDWRQGSGNTGAHFTTSDGVLDELDIQLGLRAIQRNVGTVTPTGNVYLVEPGPGAQLNRAWWNFDIHVQYEGAIADLDSLTLDISTGSGSPPGLTPFDLLVLRPAIDCHVLNCANPAPTNPDAGGDEHPENFFQASQNPTFAPWFQAPFDMFRPGTYTFTLTATEGQESISTSIDVFVVPEPATMSLFGTALAAFGFASRRRRK
jgi:PEP-CTERM motif